jgi:hypothetical protein
MQRPAALRSLFFALFLAADPAPARVVRVEITSRADLAEGKAFGMAGPYEKNRGRGSVDPTTPEELGDGFLMRRGVTAAWVGWQWDVRESPGLLRLHAPVARENGRTITGLVRADFVDVLARGAAEWDEAAR